MRRHQVEAAFGKSERLEILRHRFQTLGASELERASSDLVQDVRVLIDRPDMEARGRAKEEHRLGSGATSEVECARFERRGIIRKPKRALKQGPRRTHAMTFVVTRPVCVHGAISFRGAARAVNVPCVERENEVGSPTKNRTWNCSLGKSRYIHLTMGPCAIRMSAGKLTRFE